MRILGSRIDAVTLSDALQKIDDFLAGSSPHHIITGNTLMLLDAERDSDLRAILERAALVLPESSGVIWAARRLGHHLQIIPGIDFMLALCAKKTSIFLLGAKPGVAADAAQAIQQRFPEVTVAGTHHGYFSEADTPQILEKINAAGAKIVFVAMSVPAQEKWIARYLNQLHAPVVMGVGGSFDVLSGKLHRAPLWMRRLGIEWLYRLIQEPWRWRRIARLPVFALKVLKTHPPS